MTSYRTGNKNARNIYRVDGDGTETHIGCMFTEEDGRLVAEALNMREQLGPPIDMGFMSLPQEIHDIAQRAASWPCPAHGKHPHGNRHCSDCGACTGLELTGCPRGES